MQKMKRGEREKSGGGGGGRGEGGGGKLSKKMEASKESYANKQKKREERGDR